MNPMTLFYKIIGHGLTLRNIFDPGHHKIKLTVSTLHTFFSFSLFQCRSWVNKDILWSTEGLQHSFSDLSKIWNKSWSTAYITTLIICFPNFHFSKTLFYRERQPPQFWSQGLYGRVVSGLNNNYPIRRSQFIKHLIT